MVVGVMTDAGLAQLGTLPRLQKVYCFKPRVTNAGLAQPPEVDQPAEPRAAPGARAHGCGSDSPGEPDGPRGAEPLGHRITGPGLAHLARMNRLRSVVLPNAPLTDAGLAHLGRLTSLQAPLHRRRQHRIHRRRPRASVGSHRPDRPGHRVAEPYRSRRDPHRPAETPRSPEPPRYAGDRRLARRPGRDEDAPATAPRRHPGERRRDRAAPPGAAASPDLRERSAEMRTVGLAASRVLTVIDALRCRIIDGTRAFSTASAKLVRSRRFPID